MKNNSQGTDTNEEMLEQYLKSEEEEIQHKESGDYDIQEVKMDQIEENVNDTLDYLNLSIVEHNYAEALDKLNMIQDLQNSTKFSLCLNKLEIRQKLIIYIYQSIIVLFCFGICIYIDIKKFFFSISLFFFGKKIIIFVS